jgi:hypothetical protein
VELLQDCGDFVIERRLELLIVEADRPEWFRLVRADYLVGFLPQRGAGLSRSDRDGDH